MRLKKYNKYAKYAKYVKEYSKAQNASNGSKYDSNANVTNKNVATLNGELFKGEAIGLNRYRMIQKITELYGEKEAKMYIDLLERHYIYKHDETSALYPYCVSVSMYPFLFGGLKKLGGISEAPKNLQSFCGSFINLVFILSSQFAGAVATPEFLTYFDYFARLEFGEDYTKRLREVVFTTSTKKKNIKQTIEGYFQQIIYSMNQPAAARNFQSVFWNISYFDRYYFESIFENFIFPNFTKPNYDSVCVLQKLFMEWFAKERKSNIDIDLTFPVENACAIDNGVDGYKDKKFIDSLTKMWAKGHETFFYHSSSADSLASCCRLSNGFSDNTFSTSNGVGGIATGSKGVITININRTIQDFENRGYLYKVFKKEIKALGYEDVWAKEKTVEKFYIPMTVLTQHAQKWLIAWNELMKEEYESKLLPIYEHGFVSLEKQFLTIGINGFLESAEFLGIDIRSEDYPYYASIILSAIKEQNKLSRTEELMFNTEFVPAENLGVKHAKWDKEDGYFVPREIYNSYFYPVEAEDLNWVDRMKMQGEEFTKCLDGGSAYHINLKECLTQKQYKWLLSEAVKTGCPNITVNVPETICKDCKSIYKRMTYKCSYCGSENLDWVTRIIGYRKRVSNWNTFRQKEHARRKYM